ncbi:SET and MYND domain-containing protein 4-like [Sitodiplosis mosellana]|uniref:SET and MYND domain-containing protein 4-like n=1 Tax=Sitodiplosis mosellana TaxID=263140 RepID=UPI002443E008|nr:SET and MYND domain-containing protein 4-like [Sitodiplosis mosellana]
MWKKESNGKYTNILEVSDRSLSHLMGTGVQTMNSMARINQKSDEQSKEHRLKGNEKVKDLEWREAIQLYNKCLCFAKKDSENMSLAYANRSLCFLKLKMYEKCLIDIDLAIEADYPEEKVGKLKERRAFCLNALKQETPIKNDEPKLDFPEHGQFPGMVDIFSMEYDELYGRHLVATSNIEVGKTVIIEEAFVSTPVMSTEKMVCSKCFKEMMNFIPCDKCNTSMFCSRECADSDLYHELACCKNTENADHLVPFVARSIVLAVNTFPDYETLIKFVENTIRDRTKAAPSSMADPETKYRAFLKFHQTLSPKDKKELYKTGYQIFFNLMAHPAIKEKNLTVDDARFLMHLTLKHLYIIKSNSFQNKTIGGIFMIQRHLNHSCAPNLLQYFTGNKMICITSRSIKKGAQLFITYGNEEFWLEPTFVRQELLSENFGFKCKCEKCIDFGKIKDDADITWLTGETSGEFKIERDYQTLRGEMKGVDYTDAAQCAVLKGKCLKLLKKYHSMPWASELDAVCQYYVKLLNGNN